MTRAAILAVLLLAACTAPRAASDDSPRPGQLGAPHVPAGNQPVFGEVRESAVGWHRYPDRVPSGAPPSPAVVNVTTSEGDPSPTTSTPGTKSRTGWATWFDDGAGYYGAVRSWRYGDDPYAVQVCLAARPGTCTHVVVRDYCACGSRHGEPTVIDLSPSAFRELAPLSRGVIRVTVTGPIPIPLPPTDEEETP